MFKTVWKIARACKCLIWVKTSAALCCACTGILLHLFSWLARIAPRDDQQPVFCVIPLALCTLQIRFQTACAPAQTHTSPQLPSRLACSAVTSRSATQILAAKMLKYLSIERCTKHRHCL